MPIPHQDHRVLTPRGALFVRTWTPPAAAGTPLLLIHDSLGSVDLWRTFPAELARTTGRPVVAYDRLGFGRSDAYPGPLPPTFIRDEAASIPLLCQALSLSAVIPAGHSVGGGMAVCAAARHPDLCPFVVTMSAHTFVEDRTLEGLRSAREDFARPGQFERLARYHGPKTRWVLDSWLDTWLGPGFAGWTLDDDLRALRSPVLALQGDQDEFGTTVHGQRIAALAPAGSKYINLPGLGHFPHRQQPALVATTIGDSLTRHVCPRHN